MNNRPVRAVLFDLDGTLVDNMPHHIDAWIETARRLGHTLTREQVMRDFSGRRNEEIFPRVLGRTPPPDELAALADQKEQLYRTLYRPHLALMPGADAFLSQLNERGVAIGIASAAPRDNREFVLGGLGLLARVGAVVGGDQVANGKPAPDIFLEAARQLGVDPADTLVFEDAVLGVQAGIAAGMRVVGITSGESAEALLAAGALVTVRDFRDLPQVVAGLF